MFCRVHCRRAMQVARACGTRAGKDADGESPLRRLLDEAGSFGEAAPAARELQWATQPYTGARPTGRTGERTAPEDASVVLFPGQGAHHVGMGARLATVPAARDLYDLASSVLGWDVWRVCTAGPRDELERRAQVCLVVTALAALEAARDARPAALQRATAAAGFSLGEFAALVFAGALTLEGALRVLEVREAAMRACAAARPGGMVTVWLAADADLAAALRRARDHAAQTGLPDPVCQVAVYLHPGCKVLAGDDAALRHVEREGGAAGVRRARRLPVPGAFHTPLMRDAGAAVRAALGAVRVSAPRLAVYSCAEGSVYRDAAHVSRGLARLAEVPVRWEQTLHALFARPRSHAQPLTLALGPGDAVRATLRHVNARAWDCSVQVDA